MSEPAPSPWHTPVADAEEVPLPTTPDELDALPLGQRDAVVAAVLQWMSAKGYRITHPAAEGSPAPPRPPVTVYVPAGADAERMYGLHVIAALLEDRCPRCYALLVADEWDDTPPAYQWRICARHGYWLRHRVVHGRYAVLLWQWVLGHAPERLELR